MFVKNGREIDFPFFFFFLPDAFLNGDKPFQILKFIAAIFNKVYEVIKTLRSIKSCSFLINYQ